MYEILAKLMLSKNVSPYKVAKDTGITQATLSRWKTGRVSPSIETLQTLADYFGVSIDYLITGKNPEQKEIPGPNLQGLDPVKDKAYFSIMKSAKDEGLSPEQVKAAIDFLRFAQKRDEEE